MTKNEFENRVKLNGGCDRVVNNWKIIDIHLVPEVMNEFHEVDFYCSKEENVILLRLRNRAEDDYTILKSPEITYWIAELPISIINDTLIGDLLSKFEKM